MDTARDEKMRRLVCLALIVMTLLTYWRVTHNGFVNFDDPDYVLNNPWVNHGLSVSGIIWAFTHFYAANWHPLTWISHMLDCQLFGLNPGPHHAVNLMFHIANTVLLFLLFNRMTKALWRSAIVAALFAVHPLHVESVAWIAERKDLLSTFFALLALLSYVRYASDRKALPALPDSGAATNISKRSYACALIFFALGLMSKPMIVTLPFVMLLLDFWPLERMPDLSKVRNLILEKWPFFGLTVILCIITSFAQRGAMTSEPNTHFQAANALVSYFRYIGHMFWPAKLAVIYPFSPISIGAAAGAGIALLAITLLSALSAKRKPYFLMGWLWFLGTLVPVIGLVQVGEQSSADRYTYLPIIGLFIMCIWGAADVFARWRGGKQMAGFAAGIILLACVVDTTFQLQFWRNGIILFGRALAVTTNNSVAQDDYGTALVDAGYIHEAFSHFAEAVRLAPNDAIIQNDYAAALVRDDNLRDALPHYAEAVRLAPNDAILQNNFGVALARDGQTNAAIACYEEAIRIKTNYPDAYSDLGTVLAGEGHFDDAVSLLNHALSLQPDSADLHENLAAVLLLQGKPDEAVAEYHKAIQLDPENAGAYLNFGLVLFKLRAIPDAAQEFSEAARLSPESPEAQFQLGQCLAILQQPDQAILHLQVAIQLRPDWPEALNALAWILATDGNAQIRNGPEAVQLAKNAATLSQGQNPIILNTLAAAYAEAGDFDNAITTANQAITLAQQSGQAALARQIQSLLALYQQHRAFHHA